MSQLFSRGDGGLGWISKGIMELHRYGFDINMIRV